VTIVPAILPSAAIAAVVVAVGKLDFALLTGPFRTVDVPGASDADDAAGRATG
jgi:hypothetical protein